MGRVSPDRRVHFGDLRNLFDAYLRWSLFDYPKARGPLHRALEGLRRVGDPSLADFLEQVGRGRRAA